MESVISDYACLAKWYDSGILSRISSQDTRLFIVDYSVDNFGQHSRVNNVMLDSLKNSGLLQIVELNEKQNLKAYKIFVDNSNMLLESVAALVLAAEIKGRFITEDTQIMGFALDIFSISAYSLRTLTSEWQQRIPLKSQK